jgi:phage-related minor tail protein|tara:strand:+ start:2297 stop:2437 length:141 start_codon:yes stop_codon:yes gene_type:complete
VHNLIHVATLEQERAKKHEKIMQDFITEARFQAALLLKVYADSNEY